MRVLRSILPALVALLSHLGSQIVLAADAYPSRPITIVVPFAAGGPSDIVARILVESMRRSLGQPLVVENVVGAGGSIGSARVARSTPDGYTIGIGNWGTHVANGMIYSLPFDLLKDFVPVVMLPSEPLMIAAKKTMPVDNLKELVAWLKANPNKASSATSGIGGPSHVAGILFGKETKTQFQLVPYRGAGPAMQDLVAGQVDMMIGGPSVALPHMRSGNIKIFAVAAKVRSASAPDVPTVDEAGLSGFYVSVWHGVWAPKNTPPEVVARLNRAARQALADPGVGKRYADLALELPSGDQQTPEALGAFQRAEIDKWWPIIKAANIKAQ
jgi:tripartite-type tricarboxylate transporter receptor subunit TctC